MNRAQKSFFILALGLLAALSCSHHETEQRITTGRLLNEMVDLERLTRLPEEGYKTIQYSSYDRRSTKPTDSSWFANEDGFGNEPIPGFEKVLKQPDADGIGEYLICDIQKPGAVLRLWTAGISGKIRIFLDNINSPVYEGDAQDFFWKTIEKLSKQELSSDYVRILRQFDASYFPIPFAKRCRIEWIGDIRKIHFYHVGFRVYDSRVKVETFSEKDIKVYSKELEKVVRVFKNPDENQDFKNSKVESADINLDAGAKIELFNIKGTRAIEYLSIKIKASEIESALRKNILTIYFDNSSVPQVQSPVGDFFGAAPGLNPSQSLPFSIGTDGTMICRYIMPFNNSAKIVVENNSNETVAITGEIRATDFVWEDGKSMHFRARWRISNGLTATNINDVSNNVTDILYLMALGQGRVVGAAAYVYNPSNVPTSWGNWWGEGDEKIYVDQDTFPSFFGTGSEDYFNYSWSSARIFSFPYCGQPRNDGPGNRGYISNFRWHILDDILFMDKLAFYMELGHHGIVPDFSYGRIVYFYALPTLLDDFQKISMSDIAEIPYLNWKPEAYLGSEGNKFIPAENILSDRSKVSIEEGKLWADGKILMWHPVKPGDRISFILNSGSTIDKTNIGLTLAHGPDGGTIVVIFNGNHVKFDGNESINLFSPVQQVLDNHFSESIKLNKGKNEIVIESCDKEKGKRVGIDFFWIKEPFN
jgi:hypothetical protein